jgi:hypothetical protein
MTKGVMKLKVLAGATVVAVVLMTGLAGAAPTSSTTIKIQGSVGEVVQDFQVYGKVRSPSRKCVSGRTVKIVSLTPDGPRVIDTDRTSRNGFFFGGGSFGNNGVNGVRVKAPRSRVGPKGGTHVCKAAADTQLIA